MTLLGVSIDAAPTSRVELRVALRGLPVFAASLAVVALLWSGRWR